MARRRDARITAGAVAGAIGIGMLLGVAVYELVPSLHTSDAMAAPTAEVAGASIERGQDQIESAVPSDEVPLGVFIVHADGCGEQRQATATLVAGPQSALLLTNAHVVRGTGSLELVDAEGRSSTAQVVGLVSGRDVAVLRIDDSSQQSSAALHDALTIGAPARVSDRVLVHGYPDGDAASLAARVVSIEPRSGYGATTDMLVIDAPAQGGISGGAVLDESGSVVGLVAARDPETGDVVAYPIDTAIEGTLVRPESC